MSAEKFRPRVIEFTPQIDVEMPVVRLQEATCNVSSYGAVYDLQLLSQVDEGRSITTTLTVEELYCLRAHIDYLLRLRNSSSARCGGDRGDDSA